MERKSIQISAPMFRSVFSSKNVCKINENTKIPLEKTFHQHHNLFRQYAFDGCHPKGAFNAFEILAIYLLQSLGLLINIHKPVLNPTSTKDFLGLVVNSQDIKLSLHNKKILKVQKQYKEIHSQQLTPIRTQAN